MKAIRIFLLILIIIGVGLLLTQKIWVPKLVNQIILSENVQNTTVIPEVFSKEDAIEASRQRGLWVIREEGTSGYPVISNIKLEDASSTGKGKAWVMEGDDYHASTSSCVPSKGSFSNLMWIRFEMNISTGVINISKKCQEVIYD